MYKLPPWPYTDPMVQEVSLRTVPVWYQRCISANLRDGSFFYSPSMLYLYESGAKVTPFGIHQFKVDLTRKIGSLRTVSVWYQRCKHRGKLATRNLHSIKGCADMSYCNIRNRAACVLPIQFPMLYYPCCEISATQGYFAEQSTTYFRGDSIRILLFYPILLYS